tara:strand:+ start:420 stop:1694 length:1275 start_codon:yes stop_codon:yes gene_type:complete
MKSILDKIFFRSNNLDYICLNIKKLTSNTPANKIFDAINSYDSKSEIRYVGGCIRKIINKETVDDIDLSTNLEPKYICEALKKKDINYYETGIKHGTITAVIDQYKFEITTLRKDISTDGRHAKVEYSKDWKEDASRRDFTINAIYADREGNLFDPYDGKKDLENGFVNFIGDANKRIKEDYLRILRYLRFFLSYSKQPHSKEVLRNLKINIDGISKLSKDRLLDELKKILKLETLEKLNKDKSSLELFLIIFPELKNISIFNRLNSYKKSIFNKLDFIFLLSLMIVDNTDNTDYFLYKFNISKKNQKRIRNIYNFYRNKITSKTFTENNINKVFYYDGKQAALDILNFKIIHSKKFDKNLKDLAEKYNNKLTPIMPVRAEDLINKYNIVEGKQLGSKLKLIEDEWVKNNFSISDEQVEYIINN